MKHILLFFALLCIFSCNRVKLEQKKSKSSVINNSYYITTKIWTYKIFNRINTLEYWEQVEVNENNIDSALNAEYIKALPTFNKVKDAYK